MKTLLGVVSVSLLLAGCGKTTEQICNETNLALTQATGQGFVDVGWIGCLKQSPSEAQKSLDGLKQQLAAKGTESPKLMSHDEMDKFVSSTDPLSVILKVGPPSSAMFNPRDAQGKSIPVTKVVGGRTMETTVVSYSNTRNALVEDRSPEILKEIQGKLAIHDDGVYHFMWLRPLTYGIFGIEDDYMSLGVVVQSGKVVSTSTKYPEHLWQKWF